VDDRGSGSRSRPSDEDRLAQIEHELVTLRDDMSRLIPILRARLHGGYASPSWPRGSSATWGRGGPIVRLDAIGRVEEQLRTLRREANRLLRMMGVPSQPADPSPTRTQTPTSDSAGRSRGDTIPEAAITVMPTDDQADSEAGDDPISRGLEPSEGPGGSGPWHEKAPEKVEPKDFGFSV
jgi:hypothetical protein